MPAVLSPVVASLLTMLVPVLGNIAVVWILGEATGLLKLLRSKTRTATQQEALDIIQPLLLGRLAVLLQDAKTDLSSSGGQAKLAADVVRNLVASAPEAIADAGKLIKLGGDALTWWLTHHAIVAVTNHPLVPYVSPAATGGQSTPLSAQLALNLVQAEKDADEQASTTGSK